MRCPYFEIVKTKTISEDESKALVSSSAGRTWVRMRNNSDITAGTDSCAYQRRRLRNMVHRLPPLSADGEGRYEKPY